MQIAADENVQSVLEFMRVNIEASRLVGVAEALPKMARLLWEHYPQEPCTPATFESAKTQLGNQ